MKTQLDEKMQMIFDRTHRIADTLNIIYSGSPRLQGVLPVSLMLKNGFNREAITAKNLKLFTDEIVWVFQGLRHIARHPAKFPQYPKELPDVLVQLEGIILIASAKTANQFYNAYKQLD